MAELRTIPQIRCGTVDDRNPASPHNICIYVLYYHMSYGFGIQGLYKVMQDLHHQQDPCIVSRCLPYAILGPLESGFRDPRATGLVPGHTLTQSLRTIPEGP